MKRAGALNLTFSQITNAEKVGSFILYESVLHAR